MILGRIGVLDSGVGGLTIAGRLMDEAPGLSIHYFADTANLPYGGKTPEQVTGLAQGVVRHLVRQGVSAVVMACNTSNAVALESIRQWCPVPVVGIIQPAAQAAVGISRNGRIGVIATKVTAQSGAYERACARAIQSPDDYKEVAVRSIGCPKLVPLIESGKIWSYEAREALLEYLTPLLAWNMDTLILGCTHYPFLREHIQQIVGPTVKIVDPSHYVLGELARLGVTETTRAANIYQVSGVPCEFEISGSRLMSRPITGATCVPITPVPALEIPPVLLSRHERTLVSF